MFDSLSRIKGMLYRNFIWACRSPFRLTDVFIWPLVMLFTLTLFLSAVGGSQQFLGLLILSVIGWRALFFVSFETTAAFVEAHWDRALPNLLVSPINTLEIAIGGALSGVLKLIMVMIICLSVGHLLYGFAFIQPITFFIAVGFLLISGFSIGFILFGLACYFDKRNIFTLSFILPELIGLLSGPYYSIQDVFPPYIVSVLNLLPTTHAFNLIKSIFGLGQVNYFMLILTSIIWVIIAILLNNIFYNLGRKKGTLTKVG
ncbi:ABC transporter permease [Candidatus Micrarchaeota archaeon]|nr:ABC transporter permease [Candidatus Micrarchaeota archaeon]